jgi:hypothetical protein
MNSTSARERAESARERAEKPITNQHGSSQAASEDQESMDWVGGL